MIRAWLERGLRGLQLVGLACVAACAGGPPPPDWQSDARASLDHGVATYLKGDATLASDDFARARASLARTGRADLLARAELMRCAAQVASLVFERCTRFEELRPDAPEAEQAYADFLAARPLTAAAILRLPAAQQPAAAAMLGGQLPVASLQGVDDPLSRLIAVGVLFQAGKASPAHIAIAVDTASAMGWRRPLLGWLSVQLQLAERGGNAAEAERLRRRIALVLASASR